MTDAELCRIHGWTAGTRLEGDEGYGPTVIEITAVGEECVLAKAVQHNRTPVTGRESVWNMQLREWRPIGIRLPGDPPPKEDT